LHGTSSGGASFPELLSTWGMMLLLSAIYLAVSGRLTVLMLNRARADASLRLE
jgi:hypothetical protein